MYAWYVRALAPHAGPCALTTTTVTNLAVMMCSQFYNKAKEEIPELEDQLAQGQFGPIKVHGSATPHTMLLLRVSTHTIHVL
jgi:hypothetical protein